MKRYKLLKDLPNFEAGSIFTLDSEEAIIYIDTFIDRFTFGLGFIKNFDEWFEEIEYEPWAINTLSSRVEEISNIAYSEGAIKNLKSFGLLFYTKEEAEKHLEWLKARAVLLSDIKPNDGYKHEYEVYLDLRHGTLHVMESDWTVASEIRFSSKEDAENSIKTHEQEWKIYLGVE